MNNEDAVGNLVGIANGALHNEFLSSVLVAFLVLTATAIITHIVTKGLRKLLSRENSPLPSGTIFINIWRVVAWGVGIGITLKSCFDVDVTGIVAALGVGGIAISLGMQDTISNLIGGVQMSLMGTVTPGDHIEINGRRGIVHDITWRQLTMETSNRQSVIVPNSTINNGTLIKLPPAEKVIVPVNLYKNFDDLDASLMEICVAVKQAVEVIVPVTKDPVVQLLSVSEYSYTGSLVIWIDMTGQEYPIRDNVADIAVRVIARYSPTV